VHYFDPHEPYSRPASEVNKFATQDVAPHSIPGKVAAYDAEVAFADAEMGRLLDRLKSEGFLDNTLVLIWGDHGQGLGSHAYMGHDLQLYEEAVAVPLVVLWPGKIPAGVRLKRSVELVDLLPTMLGIGILTGLFNSADK
jgi:arylsulfatase A-like enzyme